MPPCCRLKQLTLQVLLSVVKYRQRKDHLSGAQMAMLLPEHCYFCV